MEQVTNTECSLLWRK